MGNLSLTAYQNFANGQPSSPLSGGTYALQLNPENLAISYDPLPEKKDEPDSAAGMPVSDKNAAYNKQTVKVGFTIDNSGAIPTRPEKITKTGGSIKASVDHFLKVTVKPTKATHRPPFVKLQWGKFILVGKVFGLSISYTYFDVNGEPIRADIGFSLVEEVDEKVISREFQSPDITRIVTIKDGDTLIGLCESLYDDPKHYLQVATYNNLPSFRGLKIGSQIEFPPLEK